ncbi:MULTISPECIES: ABC transporter permease [unclassified Pseudodesulfovibrio]|uniref:ABC transporter permease n=1 Tax=unclassified Pseudodesulfovibrio TaxID=2661612 RepID=UPI000FEBF37D|nr:MULTISPECIES: ABC transporter permease [unclassified Pseudodesulfovibrio]MCJ2164711.1 ABC transporter permease [Pseudodesulfovibrio sp. S3-i]RWU04100.1 ABC transporter permease [Pseudodesulfovibrio sp. S3]
MNLRKLAYLLLREAGIGVALVLIVVIFMFAAPNFASSINLMNICTQISINTVIAVGMTFVILLGGIDLSVGSVLALCTIVAGLTITNEAFSPGMAIFLAVLGSLAVGAVCGLFNGFVSERWKIHSFVVTLGMLNIARGAALQISDSRTLFGFPEAFSDLGAQSVFGLPVIFIMALTLVIVGTIILNRSVFGRMIYAIGNNEEAVRLSGHNTIVYKIAAFVICGGCVGIAGIMYMLRLSMASPILGVGFELNAIAAVVIGGTSMMGGKGSLVGTFLGACIIGVLNNGLLLLGMGDFARQIVTGLIIVAAVVIDTYRNRVLSTIHVIE